MTYTAIDLLLRQAAGPSRLKTALVDGDRRIAYGDLLNQAQHYAGLLRRGGVRKCDRVAIFVPRSIEAVAVLFGVWLAGGIAVVVNEDAPADQVEHILTNSDVTCLVSDTPRLQRVPRRSDSMCVIDIDRTRPLPGSFVPEPLIGTDVASINYTAGSTAPAKGVMVSHQNLLADMRVIADYLALSPADALLALLPFSFDYGLAQLLSAFAAGAATVIQRALSPVDVCLTIERERITVIAGVAAFWEQMTAPQSPFMARTFPSLRTITNVAGRLAEESVRAVRSTHPSLQIIMTYGLTEAFRSTYLPAAEVDRRPSSIGKAAPNVEVLVVTPAGARCRPGDTGELVHRGPTVTLGYWRDPANTGRVFRPHPNQFFLNGREEVVVFSGDLVRADEEGYLYFMGRKELQLQGGGMHFSSEELERAIASSELVTRAVAFSAPIDGKDEIALAVVPREPARFRRELLDAFCRQRVPDYMHPRAIWSVPELPVTPTGKPDRRRIRDMFERRPQGPSA